MKRSKWFNARREPPVNGGPYAEYEHRCWYLSKNGVWRLPKFRIVGHGRACGRCQWRGLLREGKKDSP